MPTHPGIEGYKLPATGDVCRETGYWRSECCLKAIQRDMGEEFPFCRHPECGKPTSWEYIPRR